MTLLTIKEIDNFRNTFIIIINEILAFINIQ